MNQGKSDIIAKRKVQALFKNKQKYKYDNHRQNMLMNINDVTISRKRGGLIRVNSNIPTFLNLMTGRLKHLHPSYFCQTTAYDMMTLVINWELCLDLVKMFPLDGFKVCIRKVWINCTIKQCMVSFVLWFTQWIINGTWSITSNKQVLPNLQFGCSVGHL